MTEQDYTKIHTLIREGRFSDLDEFLTSISDPDNPRYPYYLGIALAKLGKPEKAIEMLNKSLSLPGGSKMFRAGTHFELGMVYQSKGDLKKAAEHIKNVVENFTDEVPFDEKIDTVNTLALTYKKLKDIDNAFKYYNLASEILVQEVYDRIKSQLVHDMGSGKSDLKPTSTVWIDLAMQIAIKNVANEGLENARIPTPETATKLFEQNPLMGRAFFDEGKTRYILPAYFEAFKNALKRNNLYSAITNNIAMLYAETAEIRRAGDIFVEAIDFIPSDSKYNAPILNFEELKKEYGDREYWK